MDKLPKDPAILVSAVNMLLRDREFDTLSELCYNFSEDPKDCKSDSVQRDSNIAKPKNSFAPSGLTNSDTVTVLLIKLL